MPIPKEILAVERPSNTVVQAYGKNKDRYAVKQRIGCRRVGGRNIPVNGPTIGHIVDGAYVPMKRLTSDAADLKDWANVVYCDSLFRDIIDELCLQYDRTDAVRIYVISVLRVCYPGIRDRELKDKYEESFLSESYPGVALSRNTVSEFMERLRRAKKTKIDKEGFRQIRVNPSTEKLLSDPGIVEKEQPAKRKRGRPRKNSI